MRTARKPVRRAAEPRREAVPRRWAAYRRALLAIRETLQHEREEHARALRESLEPGGEDCVDRANDKSERMTLLAELQLEEAQLAEVEAALARIRDGSYGICAASGRPIAAARLRAIPWTRFSRAAAVSGA